MDVGGAKKNCTVHHNPLPPVRDTRRPSHAPLDAREARSVEPEVLSLQVHIRDIDAGAACFLLHWCLRIQGVQPASTPPVPRMSQFSLSSTPSFSNDRPPSLSASVESSTTAACEYTSHASRPSPPSTLYDPYHLSSDLPRPPQRHLSTSKTLRGWRVDDAPPRCASRAAEVVGKYAEHLRSAWGDFDPAGGQQGERDVTSESSRGRRI